MLMTEPTAWAQAQPWRACMLCSHGTGQPDNRHCTSPDVASRGTALPVDVARRPYGPCGPEANHLDFPGLRG